MPIAYIYQACILFATLWFFDNLRENEWLRNEWYSPLSESGYDGSYHVELARGDEHVEHCESDSLSGESYWTSDTPSVYRNRDDRRWYESEVITDLTELFSAFCSGSVEWFFFYTLDHHIYILHCHRNVWIGSTILWCDRIRDEWSRRKTHDNIIWWSRDRYTRLEYCLLYTLGNRSYVSNFTIDPVLPTLSHTRESDTREFSLCNIIYSYPYAIEPEIDTDETMIIMDIGQVKRHGNGEERKCEQTMYQSYRNIEKINYLQK